MKATQVTPNTWFLQLAEQTEGMIHKTDDGFLFISPDESVTFPSWKAIEEKYGKLSVRKKKKTTTESGPQGYPIRHDEFHNVEEGDKPSYTVTAKSHVRYYAGYFALKFKNSEKYQVILCPKVATVDEHEGIGPYKHRIECLNEVNILNSRITNDTTD